MKHASKPKDLYEIEEILRVSDKWLFRKTNALLPFMHDDNFLKLLYELK